MVSGVPRYYKENEHNPFLKKLHTTNACFVVCEQQKSVSAFLISDQALFFLLDSTTIGVYVFRER